MMDFKEVIRNIPDFPVEGVLFRDITTLVKHPKAFPQFIDAMAASLAGLEFDLIVGPEARGFVMGSALAYALGKGFVMARKPGKLPCATQRYEYALEYGTDAIEIHADAILPGQRVVVVDDLLATGGTALAAIRLVEQAGGVVAAARFGIELSDLEGREVLKGYDVDAVVVY